VAFQGPECVRIQSPSLADHGHRHARPIEFLVQRAVTGQNTDVNVELIARQTTGQEGQLFLRARPVERRNDVQNSFGHTDIP